ncbi:hypothetical protein RFH42_01945 [Acinetobacter rudis]|uniref:hypothetical protein n=1 Tax=Acinetobacter rudis TaxID=632955 RepID=UPI00280E3112|nr:hypothetical protein [Acinetobacter rudis]MDQ8951721.1 hypothetical protein [Acinetobacter rudis]
MKQEIIEALALELTKATIADPKNAELWVQTYLESERKIKATIPEKTKPAVGARRIKGMV